MEVKLLSINDFDEMMDLFYECFYKDHFYLDAFKKSELSRADIDIFRDQLEFCVKQGLSLKTVDNNNRIVGFALIFDYNKVLTNNAREFYKIFSADNEDNLPYYNEIHRRIRLLSGTTMFLLSIAVKPKLQRQGLASKMVDKILELYGDCNIVSDVSNRPSLEMYRRREFFIADIESDYFYIQHMRS